jgi:hypothetical protein
MAPEGWTIRAADGGDVVAVIDLWRAASSLPTATDGETGIERRGVASALVRAGEIRLERRGTVRLTAIVASDEVAARSLWQSLGCTRQSDRSRFVRTLSQP